MGSLIFLVLLHFFFVSGLVVFVLLQVFLVLFLCMLVVCVSCIVVLVDLLVVLAGCIVVLIDLVVVLADRAVVLLSVHAVGIGNLGRLRQLQIGVCQLAAGNSFVAFGCGVVVLLGLLVVFDDFLVVGSSFAVSLVDCFVGSSGLNGSSAYRIGIGLFCGVGGGLQIDLVDLSCADLGRQSDGHSQRHCSGAACLGQILNKILLSHNFNLLASSIKFGNRNTGGWAAVACALGPWLCVPPFRTVCRFQIFHKGLCLQVHDNIFQLQNQLQNQKSFL